MIELRNARVIIDNDFEKYEFRQYQIFIQDELIPEIAAEEFEDRNWVTIELNKKFDFDKLLQKSGNCYINNLVTYENKPYDFIIHDGEKYFDWEKLFFPMQSMFIQCLEGSATIGFDFCLPDEDSFGWTYKYSPRHVLQKLGSLKQGGIEIVIEDPEEGFSNNFKIQLKSEFSHELEASFVELNHSIIKIEQELYQFIEGFTWKDEYQTDEPKFTKEVVIPLLKRMNYGKVRYTHGVDEYGRDVIFSEINKFQEELFYGVQVKAGDVKGGANSQIDALIGQLEDAFSMPIKILGDADKKYLSMFIIVISGNFKKNAKDKILEKVSKWNKQNVFFWDRDKIEELIRNYWKES